MRLKRRFGLPEKNFFDRHSLEFSRPQDLSHLFC